DVENFDCGTATGGLSTTDVPGHDTRSLVLERPRAGGNRRTEKGVAEGGGRRDLRRDRHTPPDTLASGPVTHQFSVRSGLYTRPSNRTDGDRYSVLLGKAKRNIAEQREFKKLRAALTRQLSSAITPEQRRVEEAVRHVLAEISLEAASDTLALEAEVRRQVTDILRVEEHDQDRLRGT